MYSDQTKAAGRAYFRQNAGLKNRLIFRVYQLCLDTQAFVWGLGAYLKPLFLNAEKEVLCKRSIDLTAQFKIVSNIKTMI
jgi:hypothetical protein